MTFKKELKQFYRASTKEVVEVELPSMNFLMVDGDGAPESLKFAEAVETLFSVSYAVKFGVKKGPIGVDYGVMPLEGLWWAEDMSTFSTDDKSNWIWTLMMMQPEFVPSNTIIAAIDEVRVKKNPAAITKIRLESFTEGRCAQILHVGPFSEEGPTVQRVHEFIDTRSVMTGKHHEIYLSDFRRAAPENLKTIIRQPMK